jgi:Branched-chain amino acid ATP-binding cassette transporter
VLLLLGMGIRQSFGLFLGPITRDLGVTAADFSRPHGGAPRQVGGLDARGDRSSHAETAISRDVGRVLRGQKYEIEAADEGDPHANLRQIKEVLPECRNSAGPAITRNSYYWAALYLRIEHDLQMVADLADRIHVLDYGRTLGTGTAGEVLNNPAVIAAYIGTGSLSWHEQFRADAWCRQQY